MYSYVSWYFLFKCKQTSMSEAVLSILLFGVNSVYTRIFNFYAAKEMSTQLSIAIFVNLWFKA